MIFVLVSTKAERMNRLFYILFLGGFLSLNSLAAQEKPPSNEKEYKDQYQKRIEKEFLYDVYIPKDLTQAFLELNRLISKTDQIKFKQMDEVSAVKKLHFSFGRWMIHNWGFYQGSRFSHYLKKLGIHHPDDMATFVILSYHRNLNRKSLKIKEQIEQIIEKRKAAHQQKAKTGKVLEQKIIQRPKPTSTDSLQQKKEHDQSNF